jgi:hypothetical protein
MHPAASANLTFGICHAVSLLYARVGPYVLGGVMCDIILTAMATYARSALMGSWFAARRQ